jgi:hypothetical protein
VSLRIERPVLRAWIPRGGLLWLAVRAMASGMIALAGGDPLAPSPGRSLLLVALTVVVCFVQTARIREWMLLGNLGVTPTSLAVV